MSRSRSRSRSRVRQRGLSRRELLLGLAAGGATAITAQPLVERWASTAGFDGGRKLGQAVGAHASDTGSVDGTGGGIGDDGEDGVGTGAPGLRIALTDVAFMNRIYRERTHEIAYCGLVESGRLRPWLADTVSADESGAEFTVDNCPDRRGELLGTIHTHPSGDPSLSTTDRRTLETGAHELGCVQAGSITTDPGTVTEHLRCYRMGDEAEPGAVGTIPVVVTRGDDTGGRIMSP